MSRFDKLSRDEMFSIALMLDLPDILSFCRISKKFNNNVCNNKFFWIRRLKQDYEIIYLEINPDKSVGPFWMQRSKQDGVTIYQKTYEINPDNKVGPKKYYEFLTTNIPVKQTTLMVDKSDIIAKAVVFGDLDIFKSILGMNPSLSRLETALVMASSNNIDMIKYLVNNFKFNINKGLVEAASKGNLEIVKYLSENGATSFHWAMKNALISNNRDVVDYLKTKI